MIGAIIGDIVGSIYEFDNIKTKDFKLFQDDMFFTDDTVMTIAIAKALSEKGDAGENAVRWMRELGRKYPHRGYGGRFKMWLQDEDMGPYNSYGNGSAMRVSAVGWFADSVEEVKKLSRKVTEVSHNHPEGLKGAEATAICVYHLLNGMSKEELREIVNRDYYKLDFTLDGIRNGYEFEESCQGTVPQAIEAFLESTDFEDAIRNAISLGGDSDTLAAITGAMAEAYYGVPDGIRRKAEDILTPDLRALLHEVEIHFA